MRCDCGETTKRDRELAENSVAGLSRREMLRGSAVGFGYLALAALGIVPKQDPYFPDCLNRG